MFNTLVKTGHFSPVFTNCIYPIQPASLLPARDNPDITLKHENMKKPKVTIYQGFSKVKGEISLDELFQSIRSDKYTKKVLMIDYLTKEGKVAEANNRKRQLDFFTVTACYVEKRLAGSIKWYNDLITIDIDGLSDEQVVTLRPLIEQESATVGCFLTPKRHGFKIIACLQTAAATELRKTFLIANPMPYRQLEKYHAAIYELTRIRYEQLLGIQVDTSGKDVSRGLFASFDSQAFFAPERIGEVSGVQVEPQTLREKKEKTKEESASGSKETKKAGEADEIDPAVRKEFRKCVAATRRKVKYEEGSYNTFLFTLGNSCFRKKLDEEMVKQLAAQEFGEEGKWDTDSPISHAYIYTDKSQEAEKAAGEKIPVIQQILLFLEPRYRFRRNVIFDRLEINTLPADNTPGIFRSMAAKDLNTIFLRMNEAGINYPLANLKAIIDSDYAPEFNPFLEYFQSLPSWDGKTDFIGQLAASVTTDDGTFWDQALRRWLVGLVACATGHQHANQQALILHGKQGKGKSTWIRNLLPPELREYYRNGMIDPGNKDDLLLLSTRILINMEEFEGVKQSDIAELKRIITQENVTLRKAYDIQARIYPRRASFIGSTNNMQFLKDISGSRRFLVIRTEKIDYSTKINYSDLYGQVMHLLNTGFQYWFEGSEIECLNARNECHRIKNPVEENLFIYFRKATPKDYITKWMPAAAILSHLSIYGRIQANTQAQELLVQLLEINGFMKRVNEKGITEYGVVELSPHEVDETFRKGKI